MTAHQFHPQQQLRSARGGEPSQSPRAALGRNGRALAMHDRRLGITPGAVAKPRGRRSNGCHVSAQKPVEASLCAVLPDVVLQSPSRAPVRYGLRHVSVPVLHVSRPCAFEVQQ